MKLILASTSPRRKKILEDNGYKPIVISSFGEKDIIGQEYSRKLVCECAREKAKNTCENNSDILNDETIIVTADTVVANDRIIYGKPKDRKDAIKMIKSLSGKTHIVCTAICIATSKISYITGSEETKVTFRDLKDEEIENYVDNCRPYDKAGAYGIQDNGFSFVKSIEGNLDNVIGFPIRKFEELLEKLRIEH